MAAPGSGALNAGYAVVYDNSGDMQRMQLANVMQQQNEERQNRLLAQQKADEAHRFALQKYYGEKFDPNNFHTKTLLDTELNDRANKAISDMALLIGEKGMSDQDISIAANKKATALSNFYQLGKLIRRNIDTTTQSYKGVKGINLGLASKLAEADAIYKKDKYGNLVFKDDDELAKIDPEHDYVSDIIQKRPWLVANGNIDFNELYKSFPEVSRSVENKWSPSPGVSKTESQNFTFRDGIQRLAQDKNGVYNAETAYETMEVTDSNGDKHVIKLLPENVLGALQKDIGIKANLDVLTKRYLDSHPSTANQDAAPDTPDFETAKRAMLYNVFSKFNPPKSAEKHNQTNSAALERIKLGYPMPGSSRSSVSDGIGSTNDFLASVNNKYGQDLEVEDTPKTKPVSNWKLINPTTWGAKDTPGKPATYKVKRIIPVTADQHDLDIVAGKVGANGKRPTKPKTFILKDGSIIKGYEYNPETGDAKGEGGVKIGRNRVQEEFIKYIGGIGKSKNIPNAGNRSTPNVSTKKTLQGNVR